MAGEVWMLAICRSIRATCCSIPGTGDWRLEQLSAGSGVRVSSFVKGTIGDRVVWLLFITVFFMFLVTNGY